MMSIRTTQSGTSMVRINGYMQYIRQALLYGLRVVLSGYLCMHVAGVHNDRKWYSTHSSSVLRSEKDQPVVLHSGKAAAVMHGWRAAGRR
jgi:hypothetical protein